MFTEKEMKDFDDAMDAILKDDTCTEQEKDSAIWALIEDMISSK